MKQILIEKRSFPRIAVNFSINISGDALGETLDINETGISFSLTKSLSCVTFPSRISLPSKSLNVNLQIIWNRPLAEKNKFLYGARFLDLKEDDRRDLREVLFHTQIKEVIDDIEEPELKTRISNFFLEEIKKYVEEVSQMDKEMSEQGTYDLKFEKRLAILNNEILLKADGLEKTINKKTIAKRIKDNFRLLVSTLAYKSLIVKRAYEKPRGYPGDYRMLEIVYDNKVMSERVGRCFDKYFLNNSYAVAVRFRKDKLREMLKKYIETSNLPSIKILNLACGSCREITELLPTLNYKSPLTFTCIDWDEEALAFSKKVFQNSSQNVKFNFLKEDILNLTKEKKYIDVLGEQNLIYSIGLVDYLPDRIFKKLVYSFFQLLPKNGKFVVTHKNKEKTFPPLPPDWFCDWKFVPRNKKEVIDLLNSCGIKNFSLGIESDNFGYIFYFTLTREWHF